MKGNRHKTGNIPAHEVFLHEHNCEVRYNFTVTTDNEGNESLNYSYEKADSLEKLVQKLQDKGEENAHDLVYLYPELPDSGYVLKNKLYMKDNNTLKATDNSDVQNANFEVL